MLTDPGRIRARHQSPRTQPWAIVFAVNLFLFSAQLPAHAVEHPGVLPKEAECASCHASKLSGKSVHSVMAANCSVCHLSAMRGDMTTVSLSMPKEKICFACHQESAALRLHSRPAKARCVDCHDAHSSDYRALLRLADGSPVSAFSR